ncbi:MAG: hypothetical protein HY059_13745 [Proteobacteria bacterium]|nr:hypothetical protein [Pseudomonadota bacterium]
MEGRAAVFAAVLAVAHPVSSGAVVCRYDGRRVELPEAACPNGTLLAKTVWDRILATLEPGLGPMQLGILFIPGIRAPYWDREVENLWITPDFLRRFGGDEEVLAFLLGHELAHPELDRRRYMPNHRVNESQADLLGLHLAVRAGYSMEAYVRGAKAMLDEPALRTPPGRGGANCGTHPCPVDRQLNLGVYAEGVLRLDGTTLFGAAPAEDLLDAEGRVRPSGLLSSDARDANAKARGLAPGEASRAIDETVDPPAERERYHAALKEKSSKDPEYLRIERELRSRFERARLP